MFKYFFCQEDLLPEGVGFKLFGASHLAWLITFAIASVIVCNVYRNGSLKRRDMMRKLICFLFVVMELTRIVILAILGKLSVKYLPLHLCDWTIFLSIFYSFKKNRAVGDILYSLCLPGALSALLFCSWNNYPIFNFMSIHSFVVHWLMVVYVVMQLLTKDIDIDFSDAKYPVIFAAIVAPPTYFINKIFDTNFWFLNKVSVGSPLELFERIFGNPGFLIPLISIGMGIILCLHLPFLFKKSFESKQEVMRDAS